MTSFRVRPRFEFKSDKSIDEINDVLRSKLKSDTELKVSGRKNHLVISILEDKRHFWSPQCNLNIEESEEGTVIHGLYGPNPNVWTIFVFAYTIIIVAIFFISIFGFSNVSLGKEAPILWVLPVLIILLLALYVSGQIGQKLGAEETFSIHHFIQDSLDVKMSLE